MPMKNWKITLFSSLSFFCFAKAEVPHPQFFKGWKFDSSYEAYGQDLKTLNKVEIACENKTLVPTHPQQGTKKYHLAIIGKYNTHQIKGGEKGSYSDICQIWTKHVIPEQRTCLLSKALKVVVLSDTYQDTCGNFYRGYFKEKFFSSDETMGTLVSLGKTFYENPYSEFAGTGLVETYVGGTFAVQASEFLYFSKASAQDLIEIKKSLALAQKNGQSRDPHTGLFEDAVPKRTSRR